MDIFLQEGPSVEGLFLWLYNYPVIKVVIVVTEKFKPYDEKN